MKSIFSIYLLFLLFLSSNQNLLNKLEGVYKIKKFGKLLCLDIIQNELFFINIKKSQNNLFRIKQIENKINKNNKSLNEDMYYFIEEINSNKKLGLNPDNNNVILYDEKKIDNKDKLFWKFIPSNNGNINNNMYYIQNKFNSLFLGTNNPILKSTHQIKINCSFEKGNSNNNFYLSKIFEEIPPLSNNNLLKNEVIDIVVQYFNRKNENNKNEEKHELKYVIRSILQNIPWINKIFILLYNDNISFMKNKEEIKEKIIYIKIKDLIGFETNSNPVINFNLFKMKQFNISDNFLLMNDNYFIGQPLEKSHFFYENNEKIVPALISNKYNEIIYNEINNVYKRLTSKKKIINVESSEGEKFSKILSIKLLFDSFPKTKSTYLIIPQNTLNLISMNINEIKEIYNLIIKNYEFHSDTLFSKNLNINSLDFYTLILSYMKNIINTKVNVIPYKNFFVSDFNKYQLNNISPLFSIFNEENEKYNLENNNIKKNKLKELFPNPNKYEVFNEGFNSNEKISIKKRINNIINNIKKFGKLNYDYGKKRRAIYRKNHIMKRKINFLGRKSDEMMKIIPKLEKYITSLDDFNLNKTNLINKVNNLESEIDFMNSEFNIIVEFNMGFFTFKRITMIIIIIFVFFIVGFTYYKAFIGQKFDINQINDDESEENEDDIGIEEDNSLNNSSNNYNSINHLNEERIYLKEIII